MKILVKRVDNLGDVVIVIPVIAALQKKFLQAEITAMVKPQHRDLLYGYVHRFIRPVKDLSSITGFNKIIDIDYKIPEDYKLKNIAKAKYISVGVKNFKKKKHVSRQIFDHLKQHGINYRYTAPVINIIPHEKIKAVKWFSKNNISEKDFIVSVDPGSNFEKKCWPVGYYISLCSWLINSFNAKIILPGADEDERIKLIGEKINSDNIIKLTGKKLKFVTAVLAQADLHIGNDSGLGHVAAAVGTPVISVFGPTSPVLWKPYGNKSLTVFNPRIKCKGGYEYAAGCGLQKCLISIKPNDVADAVLASINRFIRKRSPHKFDYVALSPHLKVRKSRGEVMVKNTITGHRCKIEQGWENINPVLDFISENNSYILTQKTFKESRPLLDFFFVHRFIVPQALAENGRYL